MIKFKQNLQRFSIKGFTLIELLVAVGISSFLLVGAVTLLMNNKRVYKNQNEMGRIQENSRFAIERLFNDIRLSSYIGCSNDPFQVANLVTPDGYGNVGDTKGKTSNDDATTDASEYKIVGGFVGLEGSEGGGNWFPSNTTHLLSESVWGGDAITIRSLENTGGSLVTPYMISETDDIYVDLPAGEDFNVGDTVAVSDCKSTDIFEITAIADTDQNRDGDVSTTDNDTRQLSHGISANEVNDFTKVYNTANTKINKLISRRYFLAKTTKVKASGNQIITSLYMSESDDPTDDTYLQELVPNVSNMDILYGVDSNSDSVIDGYFNATQVNAIAISPIVRPVTDPWERVLSVRISLTLSANERDFLDYAIPGNTVTTTIRIRNRS